MSTVDGDCSFKEVKFKAIETSDINSSTAIDGKVSCDAQSSPDEPELRTSIGRSLPMVKASIRTAISTGIITVPTSTLTMAITTPTSSPPINISAVTATPIALPVINSDSEAATIDDDVTIKSSDSGGLCGDITLDSSGMCDDVITLKSDETGCLYDDPTILTPTNSFGNNEILQQSDASRANELLNEAAASEINCSLESKEHKVDVSYPSDGRINIPDDIGWRKVKYVSRRKQISCGKMTGSLWAAYKEVNLMRNIELDV